MQMVINIPEEMYKWVNDANKIFNDYGMSDFIDLVKNGTLLSKGHGDLKDELDLDLFAPSLDIDECIRELMAKHNIDYVNGDDEDKVGAFAIDLVHSCKNVIKTAPTIIEADKE